MRLFRRKPSVTINRDVVNVYGDTIDVARMLVACVLALKNNGYNTEELEKAAKGLGRFVEVVE